MTGIRALAWIGPLWKTHIEVAPEVVVATHQVEAYRAGLVSQQVTVLPICIQGIPLTHATPTLFADLATRLVSRLEAIIGATWFSQKGGDLTGPGAGVVIIKSTFPLASAKEYQRLLERYESLRVEMPLVQVPDVGRLKKIELTSEKEFPCATGATVTVIDNLYAHYGDGSIRLGMAPVLLVGVAGAGEIRYANRLSELLGTPNTVINLAEMLDVMVLKGCSRGGRSARVTDSRFRAAIWGGKSAGNSR